MSVTDLELSLNFLEIVTEPNRTLKLDRYKSSIFSLLPVYLCSWLC